MSLSSSLIFVNFIRLCTSTRCACNVLPCMRANLYCGCSLMINRHNEERSFGCLLVFWVFFWGVGWAGLHLGRYWWFTHFLFPSLMSPEQTGCRGGLRPDRLSNRCLQEMQGRFPAPDPGLGTQYPTSRRGQATESRRVLPLMMPPHTAALPPSSLSPGRLLGLHPRCTSHFFSLSLSSL